MMDPSKSFLVPFDPDKIEDSVGNFGFLHAKIDGRKQWWLVEASLLDSGRKMLWVIGPDGKDHHCYAIDFTGCPWIPLQWPDPEIPEQHLPAYRLTLDGPGGERITHEWGPGPVSKAARENVKRMLDVAMGGPAND